MQQIEINFLSLIKERFKFKIFRKSVDSGQLKTSDSEMRYSLPVQDGEDERETYDIVWHETPEFEAYTCNCLDNQYLTNQYMFKKLIDKLDKNKLDIEWYLPDQTFLSEVRFVIDKHKEGNTEVVLSPYFLKIDKYFGFIINHNFRKAKQQKFSKEVQKLSLSLDFGYCPNRYFYSDKYQIVNSFLIKHVNDIFPIDENLDVNKELYRLPVSNLNPKIYMVGRNQTSDSQFIGIQNNGPYQCIKGKVFYFFIFTEESKNLARDVYLALKGRLFPGQFKGIAEMFALPFNKDNVTHLILANYKKEELDGIALKVKALEREKKVEKVMVIAILPKRIREEEDYGVYSYLKYLSIKNGFYSQVVLQDTMGRKEQLKWSISNVALQIYCKLGGIPWLVKPSNAKCLIFGIGSAHEKTDEGKIIKYMAYTVCLDTAGNYKTVKPLSSSSNRDSYLNCFEKALVGTLNTELNNSKYQKCVIHIPFKIRKDEMTKITNAVREARNDFPVDIRAIKVNKEHKYFGFSAHNTKVPYESSLVQLAWNEYLIWTEGLQYGKEKVNKRIAEPIHVEFLYESGEKQREDDRAYLQDIINLTGANWRGFNSKAQPISILYSSLIAKFMKEFGHLEGVGDMMILNKEANTPWFL